MMPPAPGTGSVGVLVTIGPVQLLVVGFNGANFRAEIIEELRVLHESRAVRVIDSLAVFKGATGEIEVQHLSHLPDAEADGHGRVVAALIGLGVDGEEDLELAAEGELLSKDEDEGWDVLLDIPDDTAAALVLIEHSWAVPLRDAIVRMGGFRISDGFISPLDLVEIGLASPDEADTLHAIETGERLG